MSDKHSAKLIRALERRFGVSLMPYAVRQIDDRAYRVTDVETGSFIVAELLGTHGRVRVIAEYDGG